MSGRDADNEGWNDPDITRLEIVSHDSGLCHKPDVPDDTPREEVEDFPAHCLCYGSEMIVGDVSSIGMQQLGMYRLTCPLCPSS